MKFELLEAKDRKDIISKLNSFAKSHAVKTVAFAMWGRPVLIVGYEDFIETSNTTTYVEELENEEDE
jgi:hypothetical protein